MSRIGFFCIATSCGRLSSRAQGGAVKPEMGREVVPVNRVQLLLASAAILLAAILAVALAPRASIAPATAPGDLGELIPMHFGQWTFDPGIVLVTPSPEKRDGDLATPGKLFGIYSQVLGRGYRSANGDVVMLMIAYGPAQGGQLQAHRPELCYVASGFRITDKTDAAIGYRDGTSPIPITRLTAVKGARLEPVSYWMRVGDTLTHGIVDRQIVRFKFGLRGIIPDGALIRTSTVGLAPDASFRLQDRFIRDLLAAVPAADLPFFTGTG